MPPGIGYQFAPGAGQDVPMDGAQGGVARPQGPQEPVRMLSLHLPKRESPRSIVPTSLLTGPGGGGLVGSGLGGLDTVLQHLMQAFSAPAPSAPVIPSQQGAMPFNLPANIGGGGQPGPSVPAPAAPPEFVGHIDTPPLQNAPAPLFGPDIPTDPWQLANYWDPWANLDPWNMQAAQGGFLSNSPPPRTNAPDPRFVVEHPTRPSGGSFA